MNHNTFFFENYNEKKSTHHLIISRSPLFPKSVIPAAVLIVSLGILSAYTFFNIGRICHVEGDVASLSEAWEKEFGARSTWLVTLCCFFTPLGAALSYSIVLGDMFSSLAAAAGLKVSLILILILIIFNFYISHY